MLISISIFKVILIFLLLGLYHHPILCLKLGILAQFYLFIKPSFLFAEPQTKWFEQEVGTVAMLSAKAFYLL